MRRLVSLAAGAALTAAFAGAALAADPAPPTETPFPAPKIADVFVAAQTVATDGSLTNYFTPGSTVTFRAYAVGGKQGKVLAAKDVTYFYVTIPGQPNVKLKYDPASAMATGRLGWIGQWPVPATYQPGLVPFKVLVKTADRQRGQFVQMPVASSQLTIVKTLPTVLTGSQAPKGEAVTNTPLALYADSVNGSAPAGAPTRTVGCTQTNVYHRGERFVLRTWGSDAPSGETLSSANVDTASFAVPGIAQPIQLAWGSHGATGAKVWFWTNFWIIPTDYPLGATTLKVTFRTDGGKTATLDYPITVIP